MYINDFKSKIYPSRIVVSKVFIYFLNAKT